MIMTLQEMALLIYISLRLDNVSKGEVALIIVYLIAVVILGIDLYLNKFQFFRSE